MLLLGAVARGSPTLKSIAGLPVKLMFSALLGLRGGSLRSLGGSVAGDSCWGQHHTQKYSGLPNEVDACCTAVLPRSLIGAVGRESVALKSTACLPVKLFRVV